MKYSKKNILLIFIGLVFTLVVPSFSSKIIRMIDYPYSELPFDQSTWLKGNEDMRAKMIRDLENKYLYKGLSVQKVLDLLGNPNWDYLPSEEAENQAEIKPKHRVLAYNLGFEADTLLHVDQMYLHISFSEVNTLEKVEIVQY